MDVERVRRDFPILGTSMNGKPLVYLDSAATSQKPIQVIDAISNYYKEYNANIHRGIYQISERATSEYIESKEKLAKFINAGEMAEIVYTRNATESINVVALTWGNENVGKGDHILISDMEHHSNIVPWMLLAERKGATLDYIKLDGAKAELDPKNLEEQLAKKPKIVAITQASNVLGTINDIKGITKMAHDVGAKVLVDGAQSAPHMAVDVKDIDCDFFVLSGHKMLGPTGIGALYGKREILEATEPLFSGGDMIRSVRHNEHAWNDLPWKFEAGTSDIAGGIGLSAAIDYLNGVGMDRVRDHEKKLVRYAIERLSQVGGVRIFGLGQDGVDRRCGVVSFKLDGIHPHDVAQIFDSEGIAIRAGHHCAMPLVTETLGEGALSRISFYIYNTESEVDAAIAAIETVRRIFKV
ncbi:MAG: SufS family cysteine desulfurase [Candidatus Micrarchaeota archaeon]|nr:SufS family cysteine desulfurase [Candidatus Micrarchaeota archaeon]